MKIAPNTAVNIATFIDKPSQQSNTQKSDSSFSSDDPKKAQYVPVSTASSARAQAIISRREEAQQRIEDSHRAMLEAKRNAEKSLLALRIKALEGEISLQAAKALDIPSDQPFWLSQNWDNYIGGRPMMWDNEEHPQSDAIRQFLDSRPEQISEIRQLHERLDNFPDFEQWLEQNELDYRGDKAEASLEQADRMQEHAIAQKDIAMMRSNRAMQALGRSYG